MTISNNTYIPSDAEVLVCPHCDEEIIQLRDDYTGYVIIEDAEDPNNTEKMQAYFICPTCCQSAPLKEFR